MNVDVLDVNAFEIRGLDFSIRGVYPLTAMMNSVCNPNTQVGWLHVFIPNDTILNRQFLESSLSQL